MQQLRSRWCLLPFLKLQDVAEHDGICGGLQRVLLCLLLRTSGCKAIYEGPHRGLLWGAAISFGTVWHGQGLYLEQQARVICILEEQEHEGQHVQDDDAMNDPPDCWVGPHHAC